MFWSLFIIIFKVGEIYFYFSLRSSKTKSNRIEMLGKSQTQNVFYLLAKQWEYLCLCRRHRAFGSSLCSRAQYLETSCLPLSAKHKDPVFGRQLVSRSSKAVTQLCVSPESSDTLNASKTSSTLRIARTESLTIATEASNWRLSVDLCDALRPQSHAFRVRSNTLYHRIEMIRQT